MGSYQRMRQLVSTLIWVSLHQCHPRSSFQFHLLVLLVLLPDPVPRTTGPSVCAGLKSAVATEICSKHHSGHALRTALRVTRYGFPIVSYDFKSIIFIDDIEI